MFSVLFHQIIDAWCISWLYNIDPDVFMTKVVLLKTVKKLPFVVCTWWW